MEANSFSLSVIIPVFNGERYLPEALASIRAQTQPVTEIIVVDDGSTDGSAALAESWGETVQCHRQPHAGIAATRNYGVNQARGNWIAFLDADDVWLPEKTALQFAQVTRQPNVEIIFGHLEQFISPELSEAEKQTLACPTGSSPGWHCGTMLARREVFQKVGLFNPALRAGEFIDWHLRAQALGVVMTMISEQVMRRRWHRHNTMLRQPQSALDYVKILKASLDRRRAAEKSTTP